MTKLKKWRMSRNLSQPDLGALLNTSQAAVSRYESGASTPRKRVMDRIVLVTKGAVTPNDFYHAFSPKKLNLTKQNLSVRKRKEIRGGGRILSAKQPEVNHDAP